jgi:serine/threonine-protein kinase SRK2
MGHALTVTADGWPAGVQIADIWSCGVMLYVMLVGAYPFERPEDKTDSQKLQKMIQVRRARLHAPCSSD